MVFKMNLDMIRPKKVEEGLLLSISKKCETPFEKTHAKPQKLLEFNLTKPRKMFSLKPFFHLGLLSKWMIG